MNKPKKINKFGKLPINCRITVDYSKKKPRVTFGYIAKKEQRSLNYINPISMIVSMIILVCILWPMTNMPNYWDKPPLIGTCGIYEQHLFGNNNISAYNISCAGGKSYLLDYRKGTGLTSLGNAEGFYPRYTSKLASLWVSKDYAWYMNILISLFFMALALGIFFGFFGLIFLVGWVFQHIPYVNTKVNHWVPELAKKLTTVRYMVTFKKCPEDKVLEIPLFKNIFMDYDAKGEFSKYLQRVEIREHPFALLSRQYTIFGKNRRQKQKYKKKHNVFLWKARFIFKEVPKKGSLEVRWY